MGDLRCIDAFGYGYVPSFSAFAKNFTMVSVVLDYSPSIYRGVIMDTLYLNNSILIKIFTEHFPLHYLLKILIIKIGGKLC